MKYKADDILIPAKDVFGQNEELLILEKLKISSGDIKNFHIKRRSLDSRFHKTKGIFYAYNVCFESEKKFKDKRIRPQNSEVPIFETQRLSSFPPRPVIIGAGPAGLFCALRLAEYGIKSLIIERGKDIPERNSDIKKLMTEGKLDMESNVQFGLGGAGTYSDGKLRSRIKNKMTSYVLKKFVEFGADPQIIYEAKPHLGTDKLSDIISKMKAYLENNGTEFMFEAKLTDILIEKGEIRGVEINNNTQIPCRCAVLCVGNSARDTFEMLFEKGIFMEQKPIAVGVRIEHKQQIINDYVYGKYSHEKYLPTADYQLTHHDTAGRSIYTFCNCPGGVVINSSSEQGRLSVNGMSYSARDGINANSALVVNVKKEDYGSSSPLAGIAFQRQIEENAFKVGGSSYKAPVMKIGEFIAKDEFSGSPSPTIEPGYLQTDISGIFPQFIIEALRETLLYFSEKIKGFGEGVLTACETKTSTPLRILRDAQTYESVSALGLYPAGEGAGYAGGIVSSAVDGVCCADKLTEKFKQK